VSAPLSRIQALAAAAGHLCCAHQELAGAGCAAWAAELRALIDRLDSELTDAAEVTGPLEAERVTVPARSRLSG
jgi:hypothetical protein